MNKCIYFTRPNGDIDAIPEKTKIDLSLDTDAAIRTFVGDPAITNISFQDVVDYAMWDGVSTYVVDSSKQLDKYKDDAYKLYEKLVDNFFIDFLGNVYEFKTNTLLLLKDKLDKNKSDIYVKKKKDKMEMLTKSDADALYAAIDVYLSSLEIAYNDDVDLIVALTDFTFPNLSAIEAAQAVLEA